MARGSAPKTPEDREDEMIRLATDLAERQLRDGTAPAPLVNMLVRAGQRRERLEQTRIQEENKLLRSKVASLEADSQSNEKLDRIYNALRLYNGTADPEEYDDDDDYA